MTNRVVQMDARIISAKLRQGYYDTRPDEFGGPKALAMGKGLLAHMIERDHAEALTEYRHATGQRNVLGTIIGCDCAECRAVVEAIRADNEGHKIQGCC